MFLRLQNVVIAASLLVFALIGWRVNVYFFDTKTPNLSVSGISNNNYYRGDIACCIESTKSGSLSVWLDGQPLTIAYEGIRRNREYPFIIPTQTLTNGKHALKIELTDNSYNKNKVSYESCFFVDNAPLQATFIQNENEFRVLQGRTLHIQFQANKEIESAVVRALSGTYPCFQEAKNSTIYEAFIPVSCEENPTEFLFTVEINDRVGNTVNLENKFSVVLCPFKKQAISVSSQKFEEEKEKGAEQQKLEVALADLVTKSPQEKLWRGTFCMPVDQGRISCEFGTTRITQEKGRYVHRAIDLASKPHDVVWATQSGTVILKDRFASSGNTIVLDHGCGIFSLFFHLDKFADLEVGQKVAQGNPVGTVGMTGYATGPHLHWEMRINNIPVDPVQWTRQTF